MTTGTTIPLVATVKVFARFIDRLTCCEYQAGDLCTK